MNFFSETEKKIYSRNLSEGLEKMELLVSEDKQIQIINYLENLAKWNKAYNLSGIKDPSQMITKHLLDSLSVVPFVKGDNLLDVGTGAGLPGFILAICFPEKKVSLLDSNGKKTRFLFQTQNQLNISNISVLNTRVENYQPKIKFDLILSRAYSNLALFVEQTRHLLGEKSKLLAMKGLYPKQEINELPEDFIVTKVQELLIPGEPAARHLLELERIERSS